MIKLGPRSQREAHILSALPNSGMMGATLWILIGLVAVTCSTWLLLSRVNSTDAFVVPSILAALLLAVVLLTAEVSKLPSIALIVYATGIAQLVPTGFPLGLPAVVVCVWSARRLLSMLSARSGPMEGVKKMIGPAIIPAASATLLIWCLVLAVVGPLRGASAGWLLSFVPVVILPLLFADLAREAKQIMRAWVALGGLLGAYAVFEYLLQQNVLYWALGFASSQHWSVYRSEGPFGHPLLFGTFLSVAAIAALGLWIQGRRLPHLIAAAVSMAGVLATGSRGALVAAFAGFAVVMLASVFSSARGQRVRSASAIVGVALASASVVTSTPLLDRWFSSEAGGSTAARVVGADFAASLAREANYLGTGPGTSSVAATLAGSTLPIELSPLQIWVSLGVPGSLLILVIVCIGFWRALESRNVAAAAALFTFAIAVSSYNYFDDRRSALVLLSAALIMAVGASAKWTKEIATDPGSLGGRDAN